MHLLGGTPAGVLLSKRAVTTLGELQEEYADRVSGDSTVMLREPNGRLRWWTWAGARANSVPVAGLLQVAPELLDESRAFNNRQIGLRGDTTSTALSAAMKQTHLLALHSNHSTKRPRRCRYFKGARGGGPGHG
jgi:ATP-dependent Lhr-like helicase